MENYYTESAISTINLFIEKQKNSLKKYPEYYYSEYIDGFIKLFGNGFDLDFLREELRDNGWEINYVNGYLTGMDYFTNICEGKIPIIHQIRPKEQLEYAEFPDMLHDLMGHVPMLLSQKYVKYLTKIARYVIDTKLEWIDLKYLSLHKNTMEERNSVLSEICEVEEELKRNPTPFYLNNNLALWTIEFGLVRHNNSNCAYGAALVGSPIEIENLVKNNLEILHLDEMSVTASFNFSSLQSQLYYIENLEDQKIIDAMNRFSQRIEL